VGRNVSAVIPNFHPLTAKLLASINFPRNTSCLLFITLVILQVGQKVWLAFVLLQQSASSYVFYPIHSLGPVTSQDRSRNCTKYIKYCIICSAVFDSHEMPYYMKVGMEGICDCSMHQYFMCFSRGYNIKKGWMIYYILYNYRHMAHLVNNTA